MAVFLTTTEAAEYFGCHPNTIRNWIAVGILRAHRLNPSGRILIKPEDISEAIEKGRIIVGDVGVE